MPMHNWTKVPDGIYHAFHHRWISAISDDLNTGGLPAAYYALPEQLVAGLGPDVLTLERRLPPTHDADSPVAMATSSAPLARPQTRFMAEAEGESYRRRKKSVVVRHVSDDRVVAVLEIVSPGNKSTRHAFQAFVEKALELLERRIHLLVVDPLPSGRRDPNGVHATIWEAWAGQEFELPDDKRLTLVSYECDVTTRAYIEAIAVADALPDMALFLEPNQCVMVPLDKTYQAAYKVMPLRWRNVLDGVR